ncbi:MAG: twin-arginine translocation signal domain-containing protein, partial [Planctomycetota bacterium]
MMNSQSKDHKKTDMNRRQFLKGVGTCSVVAGGVVLGSGAFCEEEKKEEAKAAARQEPPKVETNLDEFMKVPKAECAIPGPFPGKVVEVHDPKSLVEDKVDKAVVRGMIEKGITGLTGKNMKESFEMLFKPHDVVGLKINP